MNKIKFAQRSSVEFVEEGNILAPKFNSEDVIPVVVTETISGLVLMLGYMNKEALDKTILTKIFSKFFKLFMNSLKSLLKILVRMVLSPHH